MELSRRLATTAPVWPRTVWAVVAVGWLLLAGWAALAPVAAPGVAGRAELPATGHAVAVGGSYAYVAAGAEGLVIFDVSDPGRLRELGRYQGSDGAYGVAVAGDHVWVAMGRRGLVALDVADPAAMVEVGRLEFRINLFRADARSVIVVGDRAYVSFGGKGNARIVDISDPTQPVETGAVPAGHARGVAPAGDRVYIADDAGLMVWDLPAGSGTTTHFDTTAYAVAVRDRYAYVAAGEAGLLLVDVSDPDDWEAFRVVKTLPTGGDARTVTVADDYLYLTDRQGGLRIFDLAEPVQPREIYAGLADADPRAFALAGGHAFIITDEELLALAVDADGDGHVGSDDRYPGTALLHARWQGVAAVTLGVGMALAAYNPTLAAARWALARLGELAVRARSPLARGVARASPWAIAGLLVAASGAVIHDQTTWTTWGEVWYSELPASGTVAAGRPEVAVQRLAAPLPDEGNDVAVAGDYAYLAGGRTLFVFDVTNRSHPLMVGSLDLGSGAGLRGVTAAGDYLYLAGYSARRVWILDISEPARPATVGSFEASYPQEVAVAGDYAYVTDGHGLNIVRVSDPARPKTVDELDLDELVVGVAVAGNYVYLGASGYWPEGSVRVIEVSNPKQPREIGRYNASDNVGSVAAYGEYFYATNWLSGYLVINASEPAAPRRATSFGPGTGFDVAVADGYLYALGNVNGAYLKILDISDPARPVERSQIPVGGDEGLVVADGYAYLAAGVWGCLQIYDVSDPADPTRAAGYSCAGAFAYDGVVEVAVADDLAYVLDHKTGLWVLDVADPGNPAVLARRSFRAVPGSRLDVAGALLAVARAKPELMLFNDNDPSPPESSRQAATPSGTGGQG